jgi:putative DeoR family transcriptional regulator (stage III sporulation protein D)
MKRIVTHNLPVMGNSSTVKLSIEERSVELAHYIIESKDTVRGAAKKFGISKSTVHTEVTLKNGRNKRQPIPESIEIKKVFLAEKNPVVRLVFVIK